MKQSIVMKKLMMVSLASLILVFCQHANAQIEVQEKLKEQMHKVLKNKIRTDFELFKDFHLHGLKYEVEIQESNSINPRLDISEKVVSEALEAESELHAAINPVDSSNMVVCVMANDPNNFFEPLTFPVYYTYDFGETWQQSNFTGVPDANQGTLAGGGDPILLYDSEGNVHLIWLTLTINSTFTAGNLTLRMAFSDDGGMTWVESNENIDNGVITDLFTLNNSRLVDKEWAVIDDSDSPYRNNLYVVYTELASSNGGVSYGIKFRRKVNGVDSFDTGTLELTSQTYLLAQFSSIDVDQDGGIHITFIGSLDGENIHIYYAKSNDGGLTFSQEQKIYDVHLPVLSADEPNSTVTGISDERLYPSAHIRTAKGDPGSQNVYLTWTANGQTVKESEGLDIYFGYSSDGGMTWEPARIINDDPSTLSHQFYPSICVSKSGRLIITWYDTRGDDNHQLTNYYMSYSDDGGQTFEENFSITSESSDFNTVGNQNMDFGIGEYTQVVTSDHFIIPFWSDGRLNNGNLEVYAAFVDVDAVPVFINQLNPVSSQISVSDITPNPIYNGTVDFTVKVSERTKIFYYIISNDGRQITSNYTVELRSGKNKISVNPNMISGRYYVVIESEYGLIYRPFARFE